MNRRNFLTASAGVALLSAQQDSALPEFQKPVFNLHKFFSSPVKIASIDLLQSGNRYFVRTRSVDGAGRRYPNQGHGGLHSDSAAARGSTFHRQRRTGSRAPGRRRLYRQLQDGRSGVLVSS